MNRIFLKLLLTQRKGHLKKSVTRPQDDKVYKEIINYYHSVADTFIYLILSHSTHHTV